MSKTTEKANELEEGIEKEIKERRSVFRSFISDMLNMHDGMMSYQEIDEMMQENTVIHGPNMWILMLAILIASIGLNMNSTAVIIGAMLISPLMSGIMTMGYSLAVRDLRLLRRAFIRFGVQVAISLFTSTLYFLITPLDIPTTEMIARTSPTIWDVLIALFGGIAGAIGNTREKKSNVIPGVAIATALMPPLCTAGYGLATMQAEFFFGALYLFLINTLFISLSTMIVMMLLRVPYHRDVNEKQQKKINRIVGVITVIVVVPSIYFGASTVFSSVMDRNISDFLSQEFVFSGTSVVQSSADKSAKTVSVSLVGTTISDDVISMLEQEMPKYGLDGYKLIVTQNKTIITNEDNSDKITIALQENRIDELEQILTRCEEEIIGLQVENDALKDSVNYTILSAKAAKIFPELYNVRCGVISDNSGAYTLLIAETKALLSDSDKEHMKSWLSTETGSDKCELVISFTAEETGESPAEESEESPT